MRSTRSSSASRRKYPTTSRADPFGPRSDALAHPLDERLHVRREERGPEAGVRHGAVAVALAAGADLEHPPPGEALEPEIGRRLPSGLEALPVGEVVVGIALVEEDDTRETDALGKLSDLRLARPLDRARVGELAVAGRRKGEDASDARIDERGRLQGSPRA